MASSGCLASSLFCLVASTMNLARTHNPGQRDATPVCSTMDSRCRNQKAASLPRPFPLSTKPTSRCSLEGPQTRYTSLPCLKSTLRQRQDSPSYLGTQVDQPRYMHSHYSYPMPSTHPPVTVPDFPSAPTPCTIQPRK